MSMEQLFILWLLSAGMGATLWLGVKLGRGLGAVIYACAAATSFTRFAWACGKEHGFRELRYPRWMHAPVVWGDIFFTLLGAAKGSVSHYGGAGVWNGIGDWTVFPASKEGDA